MAKVAPDAESSKGGSTGFDLGGIAGKGIL